MPVAIVGFLGVIAAIWSARLEDERVPGTRGDWARTIAYWLFTIVVAFEMVAGGVWDLLCIEFVRVSLERLGYALYLLYILGPSKILCAIALLVPRFPRLKEWAYAGAVINYLGAAASLLLAGRHVAEWMAPLYFAGFTLGSWGLRPATRRLAEENSPTRLPAMAWCVPALIVAAMLVAAFIALPGK